MRDVTEQLAAYFDATVERVTADDVLAGADVRSQNGRVAPTRVPRLRPAWVVAAGFVATVVLIGGAIGITRLLERGSGEVGAPPPVGDAGDGLSGPWALLIAAGVILVLAVVGLAWRSRREIVKEQDMQTIERPEVEVSPRPRSPAILIALVALLVVAAGAIGWWIGSSGDSGAAGDVPEIVELWNQAWVDGDAGALVALYAEDAVYEQIDVSMRGGGGALAVTGSDIRVMVAGGMAADFEKLTADYTTVLEDMIIYQWTGSGTAPLAPFESTGATILEIEDGLITRSVLYYNRDEIYRGQSSSS